MEWSVVETMDMDMDMPLMLLLSPIEWDESPLMSIVRFELVVARLFNVSLSFQRFALSPSPVNVSSPSSGCSRQ